MCDTNKSDLSAKVNQRRGDAGCATEAVRPPTALESLKHEQAHLIKQLSSISSQITFLEQHEEFKRLNNRFF